MSRPWTKFAASIKGIFGNEREIDMCDDGEDMAIEQAVERERRDVLAEAIVSMFLLLPWNEREGLMTEIKINDIFCFHCGIGERDRPNTNCQCRNDA